MLIWNNLAQSTLDAVSLFSYTGAILSKDGLDPRIHYHCFILLFRAFVHTK